MKTKQNKTKHPEATREAGRKGFWTLLEVNVFISLHHKLWSSSSQEFSIAGRLCRESDKNFTGNLHPMGNGQTEHSKATTNSRTILERDIHASGFYLMRELSNVPTGTCYEKSLFFLAPVLSKNGCVVAGQGICPKMKRPHTETKNIRGHTLPPRRSRR